MEHYHIPHTFLGGFPTYIVKHAINITMVNFPQGKKSAANINVVISRKVDSTITSKKDVS